MAAVNLKDIPNPGNDPNLRTAWENFKKIRNHFPYFNVLDYGAKGDGATDDSGAIQACIDACPSGATMIIPPGRYRHATRINWGSKKISVRGMGVISAFYPDTGTGTDGHYMGQNLRYCDFRDFAILGDGNVRDALVLELCHSNTFTNIHVNGSTRYEIYIRGCLNNYFNFICSHNIAYPYASGGSFDNTYGMVRVGPLISSTATNANKFDVILEGGVYTNGTSANYYQESQSGQGNNWISGVIEGATSGRAIEIYSSSYGHITGFHGESSGNILLDTCRTWTIGDGVRAENVTINSGTEIKVDGVELTNLTVDSASKFTALGSIYYNGGVLTDSSKTTISVGGGAEASNGSSSQGGTAPSGIKNLVWNGDFRRFTSVPAPAGFSNSGGAPAYVQCGTGLADTTRNLGQYCAKVTTGGTNQGLLWPMTLAGAADYEKTGGRWVTAQCYAKISSGATLLTLRAKTNTGSVIVSDTTTSSSAFARLRICFYCDDATYTDINVELIANNNPSVFYVADWSHTVGFGSAPTHAAAPQNAGEFIMVAGKKWSYYEGDPGAGGSTIGYSNPGDIAFDPTPASQGFTIWQCKTAGNPGTWDAMVLGIQPVGNGGTGASTAAGARTNLGVGTTDDPQFAGVILSKSGADSRAKIDAATGYYGYLELRENGTVKWQILNYPTTSELTIEKNGGGKVLRMDQSTGKVIATYRFEQSKQNANVTAANDITLAADGNVVNITGTTTINRILTTDWQAGSSVTLLLPASGVVAHNGAATGGGYARILLNTGANFTAGAAGGIVYLTYDGTDFRGVA